jgi:hypothetical protein
MKTKTSSYVLALEILIIILFHAAKINQAEKHPADTAFTQSARTVALRRQAAENKSGFEYMLVNLIK